MAGHSGQFSPGGYLSTVKHTALAEIEPTTFRLLVRRATGSATDSQFKLSFFKFVLRGGRSESLKIYNLCVMHVDHHDVGLSCIQ